MFKNNRELKLIYGLLFVVFAIFLFYPLILIAIQSLQSNGNISFHNFTKMFAQERFLTSLVNSFKIGSVSALVSTAIAFFLAYVIHYTNVHSWLKKSINLVATLPMLLPTITYGFAIIYSFGKQGLITKILGFQAFSLYGFWGLLIGYVIYTLPIAFILVKNTMKYMDKKQIIISKIMGDNGIKRFYNVLLIPLLSTLLIAFIQTFFLCFTDFGIPAAIGGQYEVIAKTLYSEMLGSIPNFNNGAVIAMIMLIPSLVAIGVISYIERFNIRYEKSEAIALPKNKVKDGVCSFFSLGIMIFILSIFAVIFILPFISEWPYQIEFSLKHFTSAFSSSNLIGVVKNSLIVALSTAVIGTVLCYLSAILTARGKMPLWFNKSIDFVSTLANALPGMVLGIGFMFAFLGTSLQTTFYILIMCNVIHFFSTPYAMIKSAFMKMNATWETTGRLLGDSWFSTVRKVMIPNSISTVIEMFTYYFINSMVTISAIIFLVGAQTSVITTKIKELQHFAKFNDIFVLSILIFTINIVMKLIMNYWNKKESLKKYE